MFTVTKTRACAGCKKPSRPGSRMCESCAQLKSRYGITFAQREQMEKDQKGKCKICRSGAKKLVIDHNHATLTVRGLLCPRCNLAVGYIENDLLLKAALEYLKEEELGAVSF